jgi:hypothetical protein
MSAWLPQSETAPLDGQNQFTLNNIATIFNSSFAKQLTPDRCQAIICALLRYSAHQDGTHLKTRTPAGLHPAYLAFNPSQKSEHENLTKMIENSVANVFDAVYPHQFLELSTNIFC